MAKKANGYNYVPFEFPKSRDGKYIAFADDGQVLRIRREQLGLSQKQVADMAGIQFSQYQRLESGDRFFSGCSMRIGLSVCTVLLLDPYDFFQIHVRQPDPSTLKPVEPFDNPVPDFPKKAGRKPIRRDVMTVYVNIHGYSLLIPYDVLSKLGDPPFVQVLQNPQACQITILSVSHANKDTLDVPKEEYENSVLSIPTSPAFDDTIGVMNWGDQAHSVESRLVKTTDGAIALLIDLNKAKPADTSNLTCVFEVPKCLSKK